MNKILLFVFLMGGLLQAQSFTMTCETSVKQGSPGVFFEYHIQVVNLTANTIQTRIARRLNQLPTVNWMSSICVGSCYPPEQDTLYSPDDVPELLPFDTLNFSLDVNSDSNIPGVAYITLAVVNKLNDNDFQQITFTGSTSSTSIDQDIKNPYDFVLMHNYPNPFNPTTTINYRLPASNGSQQTRLIIYNSLGQKIQTLVNEVQNPGLYNVQWDGQDHAGHQVSSGVYLYRLSSGSIQTTRKMVLTR